MSYLKVNFIFLKMNEDFFGKIANSSQRQKKTIAFVISFFITLVIFSFWIMGFRSQNESLAKAKEIENGNTPFSTLRKNFSQTFEIPKQNFASLKSAMTDFFAKQAEVFEEIEKSVSTTEEKSLDDSQVIVLD